MPPPNRNKTNKGKTYTRMARSVKKQTNSMIRDREQTTKLQLPHKKIEKESRTYVFSAAPHICVGETQNRSFNGSLKRDCAGRVV